MADPLASLADVEVVWRPITPADAAMVVEGILYVSAWLRIDYVGIDAVIASDESAKTLVRGTVARAVRRGLTGPDDGATSESVTTGPYSYQRSFSPANVYLTGREEALLGRLVGRVKAKSVQFGC